MAAGAGSRTPIYDPRTTTVNNGVWSRYAVPRQHHSQGAVGSGSHQIPEQQGLGDCRICAGTPTATGATGNLQLPRQKTTDWANYSLRLDQQFASKFKMFYNWSFNTRTAFTPNLDVVDLLYNTTQRISTDAQTTTGIGATYTISPSMISETRINYYRFRNDTTWPGYGTDFGALLGIPNIGKGSMPQHHAGTLPFRTSPTPASTSRRPSTTKRTSASSRASTPLSSAMI